MPNPMRATVLACLVTTVLTRSAAGQGQDLSVSDIVARSAGAVVTIKTFDAGGRELGLGSGFRVASGRVVTNAHVVAGASRIEVFDNNEQLLGTAGFAEAVSTTVDLAVLPRLGARTAQLSMAAALPRVGERVVVIGAPEGLSNTVSDGLVSAIRSIEGRNLLQISAPISPGSSGGPVLNARGEVIGVSVSILKEGQNLNFAVPLPDLVAMLGSPAGRVPFPPQRGSTTERAENGNANTSLNVVRLGESVDGNLNVDDKTLSSGLRFDVYTVRLTAGTRVTVSVHSRDFDSYVAVFRRAGDSLVHVADDDDSGGGLDAEANFVAPGTGSYVIDVLGASKESQTGDYRLTVESGAQRASTGAVASSASTDVERWVTTGRGAASTFSYDRTRILPMGNGVYRVWTRRDLQTSEKNHDGDMYDRSLTMDDIDCRQARTRIVQAIQYLQGKVVYSSNWDSPANWKAVVPETIGETHVQTLCRYVAARGL